MVKTKNLNRLLAPRHSPAQAHRRQLKHKTLITVKLMLSFALFLSKLSDTTGLYHYPV
ncbi:hypothetical protein CbuRSA425_00135 [Coxiella burnetii]|nr:hypothetical protein B7L74_00170 [Coxiella burnetii]OYK85297.1 hypothetical protein CbuRSA315_00135 [Coxiella burnetii]OYK89115.1 hypothetical protein CbuRSA345_00135 [Coxiella burnetii]OYK92723.1 hypothetical protein CbuQ195_00140 [Coxiella burnetii]OYK93068.1 hypothetical protein CbuRSA338_00135 [Coxiella burnetii]